MRRLVAEGRASRRSEGRGRNALDDPRSDPRQLWLPFMTGTSHDARPRLRYPGRCQSTQERNYAQACAWHFPQSLERWLHATPYDTGRHHAGNVLISKRMFYLLLNRRCRFDKAFSDHCLKDQGPFLSLQRRSPNFR